MNFKALIKIHTNFTTDLGGKGVDVLNLYAHRKLRE